MQQSIKKTERKTTAALFRVLAVVLLLAFSLAVGCYSSVIVPPSVLFATPAASLDSDYMRQVKIGTTQGTGEPVFACILPASETDTADAAWVQVDADTGEASFYMPESGDFNVFARDDRGYLSEPMAVTVEVNAVTGVELTKHSVIMPLEDSASLACSVSTIGEPDTSVTWKSSDESVVTVDENGILYSVGPGVAEITASAEDAVSEPCIVKVSDLYTTTRLSPLKPYVPAYRYTQEEAHLLDEALFYEVLEAGGYGTRAGVLAAVRFITTQFPYRVPYFFENGRLQNRVGRPYCDGEGRFYHLGLYLSTDKYELIEHSVSGPAIWGVDITNYEDKYHFVRFNRYPNGLDCSGFVTWSLLNGGFDVGDTGAGDFLDSDDDLCDLGERCPLTVELLKSGEVKAGDLIGEDGHIAIIAGIDYENQFIHVAESLAQGVKISSYSFERCPYVGLYDFICKMDSVYLEDGNYTHMWDDAGDYLAANYT